MSALPVESFEALPLAVPQKPRIVPEATYTGPETAVLLGLYGERGAQSVSEIPDTLLPKTYVGPRSGRVTYRGFDILNYLDGQRRIGGRAAPPSENVGLEILR